MNIFLQLGERALSLRLVATAASYAGVHACVDADDDAFQCEDTRVDPNSQLRLQHSCLETLRICYQALFSEDPLDLQHAAPLLFVSAFIICPFLHEL